MSSENTKFPFLLVPFTIDRNPVNFFARHHISNLLGGNSHKGRPFTINSIAKYFKGWEINIPYHGLFDNEFNVYEKRLEEIKGRFPKTYAIHGCFERQPDTYSKTNLNLAKKLTKQEKKLLENNVHVADKLLLPEEFRPLILHAGRKEENQTSEDAIKQAAENIAHAAQLNKGIDIVIENLPLDDMNYITTNAREMKLLFSYLKDIENVYAAFDFSHADVSGTYKEYMLTGNKIFLNDKLEEQHQLIDALGEKIVHAHINFGDNYKYAEEYVQREKGYELFDQHRPLTHIEEEDKEKVMAVYKRLFTETGIARTNSATMEMMPNKIFKIGPWGYTFNRYGFKSTKEIVESAHMLMPYQNK